MCLFLPLLSDSFFAPGTPKPLKVLLRGMYRLLPNPYRKLEGGVSKEVSRANQSQRLPS